VREQRVEEERRGRLGMRRLGMARLGGKGVRRQPLEQLGAVARDHVELRAVHVGVDEAGQDPAAGVLPPRPALARRLGLDRGDAPVLDQQPVVGPPAHRPALDLAPAGRRGEVEQVAVQRQA
jgi:hypothetical protein